MMERRRIGWSGAVGMGLGIIWLALASPSATAEAQARTRRVPQQHATIQAAIDAAAPGDEILVAAGRHCGAELRRPVHLRAAGEVVIAGCAQGPKLHDKLRVGFLMAGSPGKPGAPVETGHPSPGPTGARGSTIQGFRFDGAGVSNDDFTPLAFGVYGRFTDDVQVIANQFDGTVQAITNTGGDGWIVRSNQITNLTLFDCREQCGGGAGIVVQAATGPEAAEGGAAEPANRPERTVIRDNKIQGQAPAGFATFPLVGVLVVSSDATLVMGNDLVVRPGDVTAADYPLAAGVMVTDRRGGEPPLSDGARLSAALLNEGVGSQFAVVVEGEGGANTNGLFVSGNKGQVLVEGTPTPP